MLRTTLVVLGLALPAAVVLHGSGAEPLPPVSQWIPAEAVLTLEITRPDDLLDLVLNPPALSAIQALPVYQQKVAQPGMREFFEVVKFLEGRLDTDWQTGLRTLLGGGVTFAVVPDTGVLIFIEATDGAMLRELQQIIVTFAQGDTAKEGEPDRVASAEYRGVTGWRLADDQVHCIIGNRLIISNDDKALKAVIDLKEDTHRARLADLPAYQAARKAAGEGAAAVAFANVGVLKQHPPLRDVLAKNRNPLAVLLFAGILDALKASDYLAAGLHIAGNTLALETVVDGKATDPAGPASLVFAAGGATRVAPNLVVPRSIAALSFHRDLRSFYAAKDELFPERSSGLIFFENMMGIFFSGRDLTEEVLARTTPEVRLVVARQDYQQGTPQVQLPGFAAVFRLHDPESFGQVVEEAWQKALGLVNFTRGQKALPGMILDRSTHSDTRFSVARFSLADETDRENLDIRFNFSPALVTLGDYVVLSSTEALARDLIDAIRQEMRGTVQTLANTDSLVEVDTEQLAAVLEANRTGLVRQNMIEKGHSEDEAETEIDVLLALIRSLGKATLNVGSRGGRPQARLELHP